MKKYCIFFLIATFLVLQTDASLARLLVKEGEAVPVSFSGAKELKRKVPAGVQIFHFEGEHKGKFTDGDGEEIESTNYEIRDGDLIIKKFGEADVGSYEKHPNEMIKKETPTGFVAVSGPVLIIGIEKD
ncbi:unnamed protein product [Caenorhabditis sp. 36 PRJEB53466]|nr:unnamed protein product [Caenorhabditis sp. 36 PRJEB53466]